MANFALCLLFDIYRYDTNARIINMFLILSNCRTLSEKAAFKSFQGRAINNECSSWWVVISGPIRIKLFHLR